MQEYLIRISLKTNLKTNKTVVFRTILFAIHYYITLIRNMGEIAKTIFDSCVISSIFTKGMLRKIRQNKFFFILIQCIMY